MSQPITSPGNASKSGSSPILTGTISSVGQPQMEDYRPKGYIMNAYAVMLLVALFPLFTRNELLGIGFIIFVLIVPQLRSVAFSAFKAGKLIRSKQSLTGYRMQVLPLIVQATDRTSRQVSLRGEPTGADLHVGDNVQVFGKPNPDGTISADSVVNQVTGETTTTKPDPAKRNAIFAYVVTAIVFVANLALEILTA